MENCGILNEICNMEGGYLGKKARLWIASLPAFPGVCFFLKFLETAALREHSGFSAGIG